jgi:glycyl-tRNA synthetase beta subunit
MSLPFLLEIGTEEIPDWMIPGALDQLKEIFKDVLHEYGLQEDTLRVDATPRRLVLRVDGLPERQRDSEEWVPGPPKSAPAAAVAGFAK